MYGYINVNGVKQASAIPKKCETTSLSCLNTLLDNESKHNKIKWSKLIIVDKIKKLNIYIDKNAKYNDNEKQLLKQYIRLCINRKKLLRDKEVKYNIETEEVEDICNICYNDKSKKFTLTSKHNLQSSKTTKKNKPRDLSINITNAKQ
jgi:hypothetical protein